MLTERAKVLFVCRLSRIMILKIAIKNDKVLENFSKQSDH